MIRIDQTPEKLDLFYKNRCFFSHSPATPLITLGHGVHHITDKHGVYKIKESNLVKYPLLIANIIQQSEDLVIIAFAHPTEKNMSLQMTLQVNSNSQAGLTIKFDKNPEGVNRFWLRLNAIPKEAIYGCGEQYSELNLRGKKVPLWIGEQGLCRGDPKFHTWLLNLTAGVGGTWYTTYHAQPTFVASSNYYFHAESTYYAEFDFHHATFHELYFWGIPNTLYLDCFTNPIETITALSSILGRQPKLPDWIYDGMVLAIQGHGGEEKVKARLQTALDAGVKVNAIWSQDWQGINVTSFGTQLFWDWKWNGGGREVRFPNFPAYVKEMNAKGFKYFGYINSFLHPDGDLFKIAKEKDYLVKTPTGEIYYIYVTTFPAALLDLTNTAAFEWIKDVIKKNMIEEAGLSGWMSDFGEYLPPDAVLHSGISGVDYHNQYPVDWQRANYEAVKEAGKLGDIIFYTRSGYSHTSKYSTLIWAGDQLPTFSMDDGLASVIPAALSLGICGIGYHHSDIGGYTTFQPFFKRDKETFMRWAEHSAFTPVMRTHEGNRPQINVQFDSDPEILAHLAKMTRIHVHLAPLFKELSEEYQRIGIPLMRPLYLHYPNDDRVHKIKYEFLLGSDLLVANVLKAKKASWKVFLPKDSWIHVWSGNEYCGGWHEIVAPIGQPPLFYRKESKNAEMFRAIKDT